MDRGELITTYLYDAVLYDSILLGFEVVESRLGDEDFGSRKERINYAYRVLRWFAGQGQPDLNHIYLPLILGGVAVNRLVMLNHTENPWVMLRELREAREGRARLDEGGTIVFKMLDDLIEQEERNLRYQHIDPP